ncbi:MAG TPA: 3-oxoacyl-ACP reductase FabG [Polyangiaceae bacterium]|jgi:3-oxoacyl-[acyl-carrier protein] reductase|nr:3-oxoacyl-ACP reductase FabG [Polyangiaceae bacterium]
MFDLKGRAALVTGGSRGIGRAVCEALGASGAHVVVGFARGEEQARAVAAAITDKGGSAEIAGFDVSNMKLAEDAVSAVAKKLGRLDILVASAGIAIDGLLLRLKEDELDQLFAVNVKGAIACARAATKTMMRARYGRIVFLSSVVGEMGNVGQTAYAASKAALLGVARTLAREYASRNITVNAVTPGFIETDMTASISEDMKKQLVSAIPLGRIGKPEDVAAAVTFLCSDEAGYITGQALRVNGGMYV